MVGKRALRGKFRKNVVMRLKRTTSHAIRILIECAAANGVLVKTGEISQRLDITPLNVFKVVHLLSRAGFLEPVRGRNGGVRLARPADAIRIGEVVRAIEASDVEVVGAEEGGRSAKPQLNSIFDSALEAFIGVLDQHTLADMARGRNRRAPAAPAQRQSRRRPTAGSGRAATAVRN